MSSYAVHTGVWINWSHGLISGATLTLSPRDGGFLLSFIAAFITVVSSQLWKIVSFAWHQLLVKRGQQDGLHFQQRNILRNISSPGGAAWAFLQQAWYWQGKAAWAFFRTIPWALFTLAYLVTFGLLAVFSSQVSKSAGSERLIKGQQCGFWLPEGAATPGSIRALGQKNTIDSRSATTYARACYSVADLPPQCDILPRSTLGYSNKTQAACPFDESMCKNGSAYSMTTLALDSHFDFGINAAPKDRIQYQKEMTCTPVTLQGYVSYLTGSEAEAMGYDDKTLVQYSYGTTQIGQDLSNYTYLYNSYSKYADIGYTVNTAHWYRDVNTTWTPIAELQPEQGDADMLFIAFNSMSFQEPCDDPVFTAHKAVQVNGSSPDLSVTYYSPDRVVSPMGCVTKHQFCNPVNGRCTIAVGSDRLRYEALNLGLTYAQLTTAYRILEVLEFTGFQENVGPRLASALRAQDVVSQITQLYIPSNQWQYEASGWFEDSLARLQFAVQEYAAGASQLVEGSRLYQPWNAMAATTWNESDTLSAPYYKAQCSNQRTNGSQGTISFSILGLIIIFVVGGVIILTSLCIDSVVGLIQRLLHSGEYQRLSWILDSNFQSQRMLFEALGLGTWVGQTDAIPATKGKQKFEGYDPTLAAGTSSSVAEDEGQVFTSKDVTVQSRPLLSSGSGEKQSY